jgi:hypothetical protein
MSDLSYTTTTEVSTLPSEYLVYFGQRLLTFELFHPGVNFTWEEAEYVHPDGEDTDEEGNSIFPDGVTVFAEDLNRAVFVLHFETEAGRDAYEAFGSLEHIHGLMSLLQAARTAAKSVF